jgi:hypothetical protein
MRDKSLRTAAKRRRKNKLHQTQLKSRSAATRRRKARKAKSQAKT